MSGLLGEGEEVFSCIGCVVSLDPEQRLQYTEHIPHS